ncbi:MAG: beta strand repeat-containing protein [Phycisphaerae bacterium]
MTNHVSSRRRFPSRLSLARRAACLMIAIAPVATFAANATWDSSGTSPTAPVDGSGTWSSTASRWSDGAADHPWVAGDAAIIGNGGTAGTITINDPTNSVSVGGITFNAASGDYTVAAAAGNSLTLTAPTLTVNAGAPTISAPIAGSVGLTLTGTGSLTLAGTNTYTGTTTLDGGTLTFTADNNINDLSFGTPASASGASANISVLNAQANLTASSFIVQTNNPTASPQTINIATGKTLTVNGAFTVGFPETFANTQSGIASFTSLAVSGGGALVVNGGDNSFIVGPGRNNSPSNPDPLSTLDLSNLATFSYTGNLVTENSTLRNTTGQFVVGGGNNGAAVTLANSANTITADQITIGDTRATGSGNNNGSTCRLHLGNGTNTLDIAHLIVGYSKGVGVLDFLSTTGSVTIAGYAGGTSTADIYVGTSENATGANGESQLLLAGHNATVQGGLVVVGNLAGGTAGSNGRGNITFDTGSFTADSLEIGVNSSGSASNGATGTFTLGGPSAGNTAATGVLTVNTNFYLGDRTNTNASAGKSTATFTVNGGTANVHTDIIDASTTTASAGPNVTTLTVDGGTLDMFNHNIGSAAAPITTINLNSGNLNNVHLIAGNTITIGSAMNIIGSPLFAIAGGGSLNSSLSSILIPSGGGIAGGAGSSASITGNVELASGASLSPGNASTPGTLNFSNNLTLDSGSSLTFKLSPNSGGGNDLVSVAGALALNNTITLNIAALGTGPAIGSNYTLFTYGSLASGDQNSFNIIGNGSRETFSILPTASTPGSIQLSVGGSGPLSLTWIGNVSSNWSLQGDANFRDTSSNPQKFFNLDTVTFDDTSTNLNPVQISGNVTPGSVTVNAGRNYTFAGTGAITGGATLTKSAGGTLIIANDNSYTGDTLINAGTLQVGNGGATGSLGSGNISNNGALVFNRSAGLTVSGLISGGGTLTQNGSGTIDLTNNNNSYSGLTTVNVGALRIDAAGAAGSGAINVNANGTLITGANLSNLITLSGGTLAPGVSGATLSGDLTVSSDSTISTAADAVGPTSADLITTGNLHGSGNITVVAAPGLNNADNSGGFRIRGTGSDFTGNITVSQGVKFELQTTTAGPFSPINNATIFAVGGTTDLGNTTTGSYSEILLRNNTGAGDTTFGNDIRVTGTGTVVVNPLGNATTGSTIIMGNLNIGDNEQLGTFFNSANVTHALAFTSATLRGGTVTLSPTIVGFGGAGALGGDILLGNTSETAPTSVVMNGARTLIFNGAANAFTGNLAINNGAVRFDPNASAGNSNSSIGNVTSTNPAASSLSISPNATLTAGSVTVGNLSVSGILNVRSGSAASAVNSLTIAGSAGAWSGNLNINNNKLVIQADPLTKSTTLDNLRDQVLYGLTNPFGITSANLPARTALAVVDNAVTNLTSFGGVPVTANSLLVAPELLGDANIDGKVDLTDLSTVLNHFGTTTVAWTDGNFDHAATIDLTDLSDVLNNFGLTFAGANFAPAPNIAATPEPTSLALLTPLALLALKRRRPR